MATQPKKRVFLSFDHDDLAQVNGLRGLIQNPNHDLEAYDESVRKAIESKNKAYIRQVIGEKIKRSSVTVCLISATTHKSEWVDWELEESDRQGNAIIAMALKGVKEAVLPALIKAKRLTFHPWDPDLLIGLIAQAK